MKYALKTGPAKVVITVHRAPVEPVKITDARASNLRFGEMTPTHARRDRRRTRQRLRSRH